eukprot:1024139-Rhodomonas_salina.1
MVPHSSKCDQGVGGCERPTDDVWSAVLGRIYPPVELDTRQRSSSGPYVAQRTRYCVRLPLPLCARISSTTNSSSPSTSS